MKQLTARRAFAQNTEAEAPSIVPVEICVCSYNEGKGPADLDKWSAKWNDWADSTMPEAYSAWTLTPFYYGADQDFDFLWLGVSPDAVTLGRAYDNYLSNSGDLQAQFEQMAACPAHSNYATMEKAEELFKDILECNESRAYNATQRRDGMPDE
ncbi:MAG: hypothetical protein GWP58_13220 [Gammaproteobacteria bacterium]|nr:hypothetical protein [Gammaproteobacteria bacterium]